MLSVTFTHVAPATPAPGYIFGGCYMAMCIYIAVCTRKHHLDSCEEAPPQTFRCTVCFSYVQSCAECVGPTWKHLYLYYIYIEGHLAWHYGIAVASASSGALHGVPTAFRSTDKQQDLWREAATCKSSAWFDPGTKKQNIDNADQGNTHTHPRLSMCMPLGRLLVYLAVPAKHTRHTKMRASGEPRAGWPPQQTARRINTHRIHDCVHVIWNVHSYCCRQAARCI